MRFEASQHMRLGQHMKLAPRMIQSMEILQMPLVELEERIERELESNPVLEVAEETPEGSEISDQSKENEREAQENERPLGVDEKTGAADFERLGSYEESNPEAVENEFTDRVTPYDLGEGRVTRADGERDAKMDAMAAAPARSASLGEQLMAQWGVADVDASVRRLGELLIEYLDEDGFLRTPLETIADRAPEGSGPEGKGKPTVQQLEEALVALQDTLEPPGIGSRDVQECLLLQLDALQAGLLEGRDPPPKEAADAARTIIRQHWDDLANNRLPRIVEKTGLPMERIKSGLEVIRRLSRAPARALVNESPQPIIPDAIVRHDEDSDRYVAYLNDTRLPNLRVNEEYAKLARDKTFERKDREFIKTNMGNAQWLIEAVNQRKNTLLRVINVVIDAQRDFFDYGPQALKPLDMTGVAEQLGIHVATVSRAVSDKHLLTPRGVVPLRKFFTGGMQTDTGENVAWDAIKAALREVVEAEDKSKPLSDDALADELKKRGVEIARRTVAKYREQLGIPPARMRKTF